MRIAVVDDETERDQLARQVEDVLSRRRLAGQVLTFADGKTFLEAAQAERFHMAFLDIYMPGLDGVTAAKTLREWDTRCVLVFTTSSTDHALDSYRVQALQYLVKPYDPAALETIFDTALLLLPQQERYIEVRSGRTTLRVPLQRILWAEHYQHEIQLHLEGGEIVTVRMTFGDLAALLKGDDRFFVCGRGLLVNLDGVADLQGTTFSMTDGVNVPVSRNLLAEAQQAFGARLFRNIRRPG